MILGIFTNVKAYSADLELDPDSVIDFPMMTIGGKGEITIDDSVTDYTLYYQIVQFNNEDYEKAEQIRNEGKQELEVIDSELETLSQECDNLKTIYEEAYQKYNAAIDSEETTENLEELKTAFETAETNYKEKVKEYNSKVEEYNAIVNETNNSVRELTPTYVEENWIETEDGTFNVDLSQFAGTRHYTVWVMLVNADGTTVYDEGTYSMDGTKVEDVDVNGISLNMNAVTIEEGNSHTLIATISPEDATNKLVLWSSDNEDIATVSSEGVVTAKTPGTAMITATASDGEFTATCKVTVTEKNNTNNNGVNNNKTDNTVAPTSLPKTGKNIIIGIAILTMIIISFVSYKLYNVYKDVK